jgi:hypothetical protein
LTPCPSWLLASRRRVVLTTQALLLLLDLGRSIFARVGWARPYTFWTSESPEQGCR